MKRNKNVNIGCVQIGNFPNHQLTDETNGFAAKFETTTPAPVFASTSGRPQTHTVLNSEKYNENYFCIEEDLVGRVRIYFDSRQNA